MPGARKPGWIGRVRGGGEGRFRACGAREDRVGFADGAFIFPVPWTAGRVVLALIAIPAVLVVAPILFFAVIGALGAVSGGGGPVSFGGEGT